MRVSTLENDPGFTWDRRWRVTLDGEEVRDCFTADDVEGVVVVLARPRRVGADRRPVTETRRGAVTITRPSGS